MASIKPRMTCLSSRSQFGASWSGRIARSTSRVSGKPASCWGRSEATRKEARNGLGCLLLCDRVVLVFCFGLFGVGAEFVSVAI